MLLRLRSFQRAPSGIVLCVQLEKNETFSSAVESFKRKIPPRDHSLFHRRNALLLPHLEPKEFVGTVLKAMFEQLEVNTIAEAPTDQIRKALIGRRAWQRTEGNWWSISGLYEDFEVVLGPKTGRLRQLTPEVLRRIFSDWQEPIG